MRLAGGIAGVMTCAGAAAAQPRAVTGGYIVQGTNLDGSSDSGEAVIDALSDVTCSIVWITGGSESDGICMRDGEVFAAAYRLGMATGLAIYRQEKDGRLVGTWTVTGEDGVGTEVLIPR